MPKKNWQQETYKNFVPSKSIINSLKQIFKDKKNTTIPQQINIIEKLEGDDGAAMFFITKKKKTILNVS